MWRLKQFMPKDQGASLEGKSIDVGDLKLQVRSIIAQGGFSCVYLARDGPSGKTYALKHIISNDLESVELVKKEVAVMKGLKDHPNIVTLHAQVVYDMGRTKECFLVMEFCHKMLANVLENRGQGFYDEKQILSMFLQICNAVYAMHCQSPPIAHRDLKVENVLMGGDGLWKLCDFGSTSTNHKHFDKPDEMGLEEDNIRKHTTPAYRAPEMWDLFQRELINEKVDIWALGCVLYRIAFLKSAFDGESKLQILNGNYKIPEVPRYSAAITGLIRDMLNPSPEARPDVMQVWQRVNEALPSDMRKLHPDKPPSTSVAPSVASSVRVHSDIRPSVGSGKAPALVPTRVPPLPPKEAERRPTQNGSTDNHSAKGAFWSTPYAQNAQADGNVSRQERSGGCETSPAPKSSSPPFRSSGPSNSPPKERNYFPKKSSVSGLMKRVQGSIHSAGGWGRDDPDFEGYEMRQDSDEEEPMKAGEADLQSVSPVTHAPKSQAVSPAAGSSHAPHMPYVSNSAASMTPAKASRQKFAAPESAGPSSDPAFNAFAADFDQSLLAEKSVGSNERREVEFDRLHLSLKQALADKAEITAKFEKLTVICRAQRQEIQDLKSSIGSGSTPSFTFADEQFPLSSMNSSLSATSTPQPELNKLQQRQRQQGGIWQSPDKPKEKQSGTIWDLQEGLSPNSAAHQQLAWEAFRESPQQGRALPRHQGNETYSLPSSLGMLTDGRHNQHTRTSSLGGGDSWNMVQDKFSSQSGHGSKTLSPLGGPSTTSSNASSKPDSWARTTSPVQPAGWAGF